MSDEIALCAPKDMIRTSGKYAVVAEVGYGVVRILAVVKDYTIKPLDQHKVGQE